MHNRYEKILMETTTSSRGGERVSTEKLFTLFNKYDSEMTYHGEITPYPIAPPILGEASVLSPSFIGEEKILIKSIPKFIGESNPHPIYTAYNSLKGNQEAMEVAFRLGNQFNPNKDIYISSVPLLGVEIRKEKDGSEQAYIVLGETSDSAETDPGFPSAVIMRELPPHDSIEDLMKRGAIDLIQNLLPEAFANLHQYRTEALPYEQAKYWGSYDAIYGKFQWNFQDCMDVIKTLKNSENIEILKRLKDMYKARSERELMELIDADVRFLNKVVNDYAFGKNNPFKKIAEERIEQGFIRRTHGDPKAANLRFATSPFIYGAPQSDHIIFLDHVDFEPSFEFTDIAEDWAHFKSDMASLIREDFRRRFMRRDLPKMERRYFKKTNQTINPNTQALYKLHTLGKNMVRLNSKVKYKGQFNEGITFLPEIMNSAEELFIQLEAM
ncbi:MAG TPA: hypothetical protein VLG12_00935 [Candidatus Saccharimonadales bacterium]|nr:hypothetical protein [Candidatus Saccharimonadales bacterium]